MFVLVASQYACFLDTNHWVIRIVYFFLGIHCFINLEFHIRLSAANPNFAHQNIFYDDFIFPGFQQRGVDTRDELFVAKQNIISIAASGVAFISDRMKRENSSLAVDLNSHFTRSGRIVNHLQHQLVSAFWLREFEQNCVGPFAAAPAGLMSGKITACLLYTSDAADE